MIKQKKITQFRVEIEESINKLIYTIILTISLISSVLKHYLSFKYKRIEREKKNTIHHRFQLKSERNPKLKQLLNYEQNDVLFKQINFNSKYNLKASFLIF